MRRILSNSRLMFRACGARAGLRYIALASLLVLNACATLAAPQTINVRWVRVEDPHAACIANVGHLLPKLADGAQWRGCVQLKDGFCTIYARDFHSVHSRELMATLGHELKHCFDGAWHK